MRYLRAFTGLPPSLFKGLCAAFVLLVPVYCCLIWLCRIAHLLFS